MATIYFEEDRNYGELLAIDIMSNIRKELNLI
jgi:hypothetical protein